MKLAYSLSFRLTILYLLIVLVPILIIMIAMPSYYQNSITRDPFIIDQVLTKASTLRREVAKSGR